MTDGGDTTPKAYLAVYDTLADWEPGYLLAELRTGRFTGRPWSITTVGPSRDPVTTMGGVRIQPDLALAELEVSGELLILPGAAWEGGGLQEFAALAGRFLAAGVPVAAICGATFGLAKAGLLDERPHTSAARQYLAATGYGGGELYRDERAVAAEDLVTAGPQSPVQWATAVLGLLGLMSPPVREAYEAVMHRGDQSAYPALMAAAQKAPGR